MKLKQLILLYWLLVCLLATASCSGAGLDYSSLNPDLMREYNLHQVSAGLYRSAQPNAAVFSLYEKAGIKTIINLRSLHSDKDEIVGTSLTLVEIPVVTWWPEYEEVIATLRAIRQAEKPVLIHCWHGSDRTGLMVAMYRIIEEGWSKEDAINEMQNGPYGFHSIWGHIDNFIMGADIENIKAALH